MERPDFVFGAVEKEPFGADGFFWAGRTGKGARASSSVFQSVSSGSQSGVFAVFSSDIVGAGRREAGVESIRGSVE